MTLGVGLALLVGYTLGYILRGHSETASGNHRGSERAFRAPPLPLPVDRVPPLKVRPPPPAPTHWPRPNAPPVPHHPQQVVVILRDERQP